MPHSQHHHGHVVARDETTPPPSDAKSARAVLDEGVALVFAAPHSFTGEHVLELQGHGGPVVLQMLLTRLS